MGRDYQGRLPGGGGPLVDSRYSDRLLRDGEKKLVSMHFVWGESFSEQRSGGGIICSKGTQIWPEPCIYTGESLKMSWVVKECG